MSDQDALFDVEAPTPASSWVYVIGAPNASIVKIGVAADTTKRLRGIQTSSPTWLVVRWRTPGDRILEQRLHDEFREFRKAGEWFDFGDNDPVRMVAERVGVLSAPTEPAEDDTRDLRRPAPGDPHGHLPEYQPDDNGCRPLTPTESVTELLPDGIPGAYCTGGDCEGSH